MTLGRTAVILISGVIMFRSLQSLLQTGKTANVAAFLTMIRQLESNNDYGALVFGGRFTDFNTHPNIKKSATINGRVITSTAAGAYQFLYGTFKWLNTIGVMPDMTPSSQDAGAIFLLKTSGALALINAGDFAGAVKRAAVTWASLPFSPYNQNAAKYSQALRLYRIAGGVAK